MNFIFDWSGTLNDNFHLFYKVYLLFCEEFKVKPDSEDGIRMHFNNPYMLFWNHYFPDLSQEQEDVLYAKFILQVGQPKKYPGVTETITYLAKNNASLFVVSSDRPETLLPEAERARIQKQFKEIITSTYVKEDAIRHLVKKYNLSPQETFYVGDTSGDITSGRAAGVRTIGITWGFQPKEILKKSKPDFLIDDISELKEILKTHSVKQ
jgi:phosphoglycolate phosphatase